MVPFDEVADGAVVAQYEEETLQAKVEPVEAGLALVVALLSASLV
jgi:hypothetical protein